MDGVPALRPTPLDEGDITFVAFLRGINVGGRKRIQMNDLIGAFEALGYRNVRTLLASGNVRFETPAAGTPHLVQAIEQQLHTTFGFDVGVIVRTIEEIRALLGSAPFKEIKVTAATRLYVTFFAEQPRSTLKIPYESAGGAFRILRASAREACSVLTLSPNERTLDLMNVLEKEYGRKITTRSWNTIVALLDR